MSGAVAGLIGSLKAAAVVAPTNLVTNGSASANINGWTNLGNTVRDTSTFKSSPASIMSYDDEVNGVVLVYNQASTLTVGQSYSLSVWIRNAGASSLAISMTCGTNSQSVSFGVVAGSTEFRYYKLENVSCVGTSALQFTVSVEGEGNVDDCAVVLGATALP